MDLIRSTWRTDIDPGLVLEDQVFPEVLGFAYALRNLQNPEIQVVKFGKILENIGTLPTPDIGVGHPGRIPGAHLICQLQQPGIENFPVVEQRGPDQAGKYGLGYDLQAFSLSAGIAVLLTNTGQQGKTRCS
jgi:hypothetical protein